MSQTQNFRKAAELCVVAQSALSRQIAALEDELEVALFTRKNKRVTLTAAGQEFALHVRNAMEQLREKSVEVFVRKAHKNLNTFFSLRAP
ncbi:MAG TPA: LysR family transcriptional regulator [Ktedonobacteraceae bacterium]|nr:LysR family transcriptional regulator [Ktedonobacteraceae bacterium]